MDNPHRALFDLLFSRYSCREFLADEIPESILRELVSAARCAPSSANLQPGKLHVFTGEPLALLRAQLSDIAEAHPPEPPAYSYFPQPMSPTLKTRQREAGYALYQALNISRRDLAGRRRQFAANYRFFDAPVGIIVTIERNMGKGCFMDLGMMLMSFFLLAQSLGYHTCAIGALSHYAETLHKLLALPADERVVCGIALGRANPNAAVNQFRTQRQNIDDYAAFYGFDDKQAPA